MAAPSPPSPPRHCAGKRCRGAAVPQPPRWVWTKVPRVPAPAASGSRLMGSICRIVLGITNCIIQTSKTTKGDRLAARLTKAPCLEAPAPPNLPEKTHLNQNKQRAWPHALTLSLANRGVRRLNPVPRPANSLAHSPCTQGTPASGSAAPCPGAAGLSFSAASSRQQKCHTWSWPVPGADPQHSPGGHQLTLCCCSPHRSLPPSLRVSSGKGQPWLQHGSHRSREERAMDFAAADER